MGSEQSHQAYNSQGGGASTSMTTGDLSSFSAGFRDGAMSPRQDSVCSDSEVPYVSYTVSKPIGDSPSKKGKKTSGEAKGGVITLDDCGCPGNVKLDSMTCKI